MKLKTAKRRVKAAQTTTLTNAVRGLTFTIVRGNEMATLKTRGGTYILKQSSYDSKLYKGCANAYDVEMRIEAGQMELSYKPKVH